MVSNLPPGCRDSDIPGNSAQDQRDEALAARLSETVVNRLHLIGVDTLDLLVLDLMQICEDVYREGYEARTEEQDYE